MENMQTSPSVNAILTTMREMPIAELEQLVDQVIAIRAERVAPHLSADESALLARINQSLPSEDRDRIRALIGKRDDETITAEEWRELAAMTALSRSFAASIRLILRMKKQSDCSRHKAHPLSPPSGAPRRIGAVVDEERPGSKFDRPC